MAKKIEDIAGTSKAYSYKRSRKYEYSYGISDLVDRVCTTQLIYYRGG